MCGGFVMWCMCVYENWEQTDVGITSKLLSCDLLFDFEVVRS